MHNVGPQASNGLPHMLVQDNKPLFSYILGGVYVENIRMLMSVYKMRCSSPFQSMVVTNTNDDKICGSTLN